MLSNKEQIGKLDKRITFQEKIIGVNVSNEDEEAGWQNLTVRPVVWAQVDERSGTEVYQAEKLTGLSTAIFTIRYRVDLSLENRIVYNGFKWDIHSIKPESRRGYLKITAESGGEYQEVSAGGFSEGFSDGFNT